jgi:hypothetical protein
MTRKTKFLICHCSVLIKISRFEALSLSFFLVLLLLPFCFSLDVIHVLPVVTFSPFFVVRTRSLSLSLSICLSMPLLTLSLSCFKRPDVYNLYRSISAPLHSGGAYYYLSSSFVSLCMIYILFIGYNPVGRILRARTQRLVQARQGDWQIYSKRAHHGHRPYDVV